MSTTTFKPGKSGNPRGRPRGTGQVAKLREQIAKHVPDIIEALAKAAKAGDGAAARILLERAIPPMKHSEEAPGITLPADGTLADQGRAVLAAAGPGGLPPGQVAALLAGLAAQAKVIEATELSDRIAALEARLGAAP